MVCVHCGAATRVTNSRLQRRVNQVWRRRQCLQCGALFTTEERPVYAQLWMVAHDPRHLEPFSRDKLVVSLERSLQHRSSPLADAGALADTIIAKLRGKHGDGRLSNREIARVAQVALSRFDKIASLHYGALHAA